MKGFRQKTGKFGSLISLLSLTAMLILFSVNVPVFLNSTAGQIFAGAWAVFSLIMFSAHCIRLAERQERHVPMAPLAAGPKDARTRKNIRMVRAMRG